jgi:hypothetical protein
MPDAPLPGRKRFASSIFDDPDSQMFEVGREVYALLRDLGFQTTKAVWPTGEDREPFDHAITCAEDLAYVDWLLEREQAGFEIGRHNATLHSSTRPSAMAHHCFGDEKADA